MSENASSKGGEKKASLKQSTLAQQVTGGLAVRSEAQAKVSSAQSELESAQAQLRKLEKVIDPRVTYIFRPKLDSEPLVSKYWVHYFWHDDEGRPELSRTEEVTMLSPFIAAQSVEVDYQNQCIRARNYGDPSDNHYDWSFSQAGSSSWYEMEVPFGRIGDVEILETNPETHSDALLVKAVRNLPGMSGQ